MSRPFDAVIGAAFVGVFFCFSCSSGGEEESDDGNDSQTDGEGGATSTASGGSGGDGSSATGGDSGSSGGSSSDQGTGGGGSSVDTGPSMGCGTDLADPTAQWVEQSPVRADNRDWQWWAWFPENYDPERAYPLVVLFHGCGDETNNLPIEQHSGQDAIVIRARSAEDDGCWFDGTEPNRTVFNGMVEGIGESSCVDLDEIFAVGYDSGARLLGRFSCHLAYRIKGIATVAGGNTLSTDVQCGGPTAAMLIHDEDDNVDDISSSEELRDRLIEQNFCVTDGIPSETEPAPCVSYSGCGDPVIWCATSGEGHDRQDGFAPAIWDFFAGL